MDSAIERLRHAPLTHVLHAFAAGRMRSRDLLEAALGAIAQDAALGAWLHVDAAAARAAADQSDARRAHGGALGRLDGLPIAIDDLVDVQGWPTSLGLAARSAHRATADASLVERLRGAGAVLIGKTAVDEGGFGASGRTVHVHDVGHPLRPELRPGGPCAGAAVAVARGHAVAALGPDTLGSVRIPAAFCGLVGLRPSFGEISCRGVASRLRRLDCPALLVRAVADAGPLLQVLVGHDPGDPRSRRRRVPLATPDWAPGNLRAGVVDDLAALGAEPAVVEGFTGAVDRVAHVFGETAPVPLDLAQFDVAATRRAALLLMEAELLAAHAEALATAGEPLRRMLAFAETRSAVDYARADRRLDSHVVRLRRLFERFDVLLLPSAPVAPPRRDAPEPHNIADFAAVASLAGCPALSLPLPGGIGLELVGLPGSDLRLLELGEVLEAVLGGAHD